VIILRTGLPGAGKTLMALHQIEEERKRTGRPVFYSGIAIHREKLPDWQEIKGDEWYTAPPEAIVVIDEAQRIFRPRANGSQVPRYEAELETHRHLGIDLHLITQQPRLVSVNVRSLAGRHIHAVRPFGAQRVTLHEWQEVRMDTTKRDDSTARSFAYPKHVYGWYKSAEAHTHKLSIPPRVWLLVGLVVVGPLLAWFGFSKALGVGGAPDPQPSRPGARVASPSGGAVGAASEGRTVLSTADYLRMHSPRVQGLAYTAPVYDQVTQPTEAPYPAACVSSYSRCQCYTTQGTRLETPADLCRRIARDGFFVAWRPVQSAAPAPQPAPPAPAPSTADGPSSGNLHW
jgi:zona occludens toxin